jgi:hypothetical protein
MGTNVIGRKYNDHAATDRDDVRCKRIFVRSLTAATHGNATGIGIAEFTNRRTAESVDPEKTRINCITGGHPTAAMLPVIYERDRDAVEAALQTIGLIEPHQARIIQISNTLQVAEVLVSEAYRNELRERPDLSVIADSAPMAFDVSGNLAPVAPPADAQH